MGIPTLADYYGWYEHHDIETIQGDFDAGWGAWLHSGATRVAGGYEGSAYCIQMNKGDSITYNYPNGTYATGVSFFCDRNYASTGQVLVAVRFTDLQWYNNTVSIGTVQWTQFAVPTPWKEIQTVLIKYSDEQTPGACLKIDDVALVVYCPTYAGWSLGMYTDISPHQVLGLSGGRVTVAYAAYTELLVDSSRTAMLDIDFGPGLTNVNVNVIHMGVSVFNATGDAQIPIRVSEGINRFSFYVTALNSEQGYLKVRLSDGVTGIPVTVLGQGCGLAAITSSETTYTVPVSTYLWNPTTTANTVANVTSKEGDLYLRSTIAINNSNDLTLDSVTYEVTPALDIRGTPVLHVRFFDNATGLLVKVRAQLRSGSTNESVWVETEWVNMTDIEFIRDITYMAARTYNTSSGDYVELLTLQLIVVDVPGDGVAAGPKHLIQVIMGMSQRVGYVYRLEEYTRSSSALSRRLRNEFYFVQHYLHSIPRTRRCSPRRSVRTAHD